MILFRPNEQDSVRQLMFELRNGEGIPPKFVDKIDGRWREIERHSERLVNKDYGERLDADRERRNDVILTILREEALKGKLYSPSAFSEAFENESGLASTYAIRERISVLATKGYIKFNKGKKTARSKYGEMCIEGMLLPDKDGNVDANGEILVRPILPTHFKHPQSGALMPVENPAVWVYPEEDTP